MEKTANKALKLTKRGWLMLVIIPMVLIGFTLTLGAALTPGLLTPNGASFVGVGLVISGMGVAIKRLNI